MLLNVANVNKSFANEVVLRGASFRMERREKVAFVGRNGTGKSTLLKIILGHLEPDGGSVQLTRGAKVGYLKQETPVGAGRTVIEEAQEGMRRQVELSDRLEVLENKLAHEPTDDDLAEYALLHEHFLEAEGYSAERDLRVVLNKLGFTEDEFDKPTSSLSGGEKTRLAIARLLLEEPDLLVLDEPTNHLDLQATEWLERWITAYHGAVLLVSHDRAFLDATADRVLELGNHAITAWPGPFPKFLQLKAEAQERQATVAKRQDLEIAKMDEYVRRFMNSQRTAQARGRLKLMNRLIESKVDAPKKDKGMKAGFGPASRSGDLVIETKKLAIGFPGLELMHGLDWTVRFGERWGVIGENGAGKSTLMKVILGQIEPTRGQTRLGAGVKAGFFTQDAEDMDLDLTPLDLMVYECGMSPENARTLLGRFLIEGDDVYRPAGTLSGGEKNKLALARLTVLNPNLLVLDEPTNHLDMDSREALAIVLREYTGTLILVSHDRWLLGQTTERILDIKKSGPVIYPGGYAEYRRGAPTPSVKPVEPLLPKLLGDEPKQEPTLSPRELSKEIQRLEKLVAQVELEIADREDELSTLESELASLSPTADVFELTRRHQALQEQIEGSMSTWEENSRNLDRLRTLQGVEPK